MAPKEIDGRLSQDVNVKAALCQAMLKEVESPTSAANIPLKCLEGKSRYSVIAPSRHSTIIGSTVQVAGVGVTHPPATTELVFREEVTSLEIAIKLAHSIDVKGGKPSSSRPLLLPP